MHIDSLHEIRGMVYKNYSFVTNRDLSSKLPVFTNEVSEIKGFLSVAVITIQRISYLNFQQSHDASNSNERCSLRNVS